MTARSPSGSHRRLRYLTVYLVAVAASLGFVLALSPVPTGDEPHYLLYSLSIINDGDLDLTNDYASVDRVTRVYPPGVLGTSTHARAFVPGGPLRSLHSPLLPALVAPLLAAGASWFGVRVAMGLLTAAAIPLLLSILDRLRGRRASHVFVAGAVATSLPYICYFTQLFPDALGALLVLVGLRACLSQRGSPWWWAGVAAAVLLPWLHTRYVTLALAIAVGLALPDLWSWLRHPDRASFVRAVRTGCSAGGWLVLSLAGVLVFNRVLYGQASFSAQYQGFPFNGSEISAGNLYRYSFGDLFSRHYGIVSAAPLYLVGVVGIGLAVRRWRLAMIAGLAGALAYYLPSTMLGLIGGYSPLGRYTVPVLVLLAIPGALVLDRHWGRVTAGILAAVSVAGSVVAAMGPASVLYPDESVTWRLPVAATYSRLFPTALQPTFPQAASIGPALLSSDVGGLRDLPGGPARRVTTADGRGYFAFGPFLRLEPGPYVATFDIEVTRGAVRLDVATRGDGSVAALDVPVTARRLVDVPFRLKPKGIGLETRAFVSTPTAAALYGVNVRRSEASSPGSRFPSWWGPAAWIVGLAALGLWLLRQPGPDDERPRRRREGRARRSSREDEGPPSPDHERIGTTSVPADERH